MSLQRVPINNFRGGLNTRDGVYDLQPNESPDLLNVTISALVGTLESRKGKTRVDISGMPNASVDRAKQAVIGAAGVRFLMLSINGAVYAMNPAGEVKKIHAGTAGSVWDFEVYSDAANKDWVYMGNGVDAMLKWDGVAAEAVAWAATKGAIPKGGVLCVWENRMFITYVGTQSQRLYFSEFSDPEATLNEYGFVDIRGSEEDLDAIQDLCVLGARLIVLKRRGVFFISNSVTMANRHIGGPGVWGRFMTTELEDKVYFFNAQGLFSTGGVTVAMESGSINNFFPKELNRAKLENTRMMATNDTYPRLLLAITTGVNTANDKLIEMVPHINFRRIGGRRYLLLPAFMLHTIKATALAAWNPFGSEETMVGIDKSTSTVIFPALAVTDTFNRANENPLNFGGKWAKLLTPTGGGEGHSSLAKLVNKEAQAGSFSTEYNLWESAAVIKEPETTCRVNKGALPLAVGRSAGIGLTACVTGPPATWSGYALRWSVSNVGFLIQELELLRVTNGETLVIGIIEYPSGGVKIPEVGDELGLTVQGGRVYVGIKPNGGIWETLFSVADATYKEGRSGIILEIADYPENEGFGINNFAVAAWANTAVETAAAFQLFNGATDDGAPIAAHWTSSWMAVQGEEPKERIRRLNIELSGEAEVEVFKDFSEVPSFSAPVPKAEGVEPKKYRFVRLRPETHGRFHQVRVKTNASGIPFVINAMELAVRGGKEH